MSKPILSQFLILLENSHHLNNSSSAFRPAPKNAASQILQSWGRLFFCWMTVGYSLAKETFKTPHAPHAICSVSALLLRQPTSFIPHNLEFIIRLYLSQVTNSIVKEILISLSFCTKYQNSLMDNKFQCQAGLESPWLLVRPSHPVVYSAYIWGTPHAVAQAVDGPDRDGWRGFPPHFLKAHPSLSP